MRADVTVILPIIELGDLEKDLFANAINSISTQKVLPKRIVLVVPKNSDIKTNLESYEFPENIKEDVLIIENEGNTDFCSQVNLGSNSVETEWLSILEIDDVYSTIWLDNFVTYSQYYTDVDVFLPIVLDVDTNNRFIHFTNEPVWARDFSDKLGFLDSEVLNNFPNFQLSGAVIRKEPFRVFGKLKSNVKMFFNYEFLMRMSYYDKKIMTIPKIGYKKINMRENSLFWRYKNVESEKMDPTEQRFWFNQSKKECYYKTEREIEFNDVERGV
jgi:hypothetical protein